MAHHILCLSIAHGGSFPQPFGGNDLVFGNSLTTPVAKPQLSLCFDMPLLGGVCIPLDCLGMILGLTFGAVEIVVGEAELFPGHRRPMFV